MCFAYTKCHPYDNLCRFSSQVHCTGGTAQNKKLGLVTAWATLGWGQACVIGAFVEIHLEAQVVVKSTITQA